MGEVYTYDGTHLTTIRDESVELVQMAELGAIGTGRVVIDDTNGTLDIVGQMDFSATQSSCSIPLMFRGFVENREYSRDAGIDRAPHVGAARGISVSLQDLNSMLGHRVIRKKSGLTTAEGGKRPSETVAARGAWLLASPFVAFTDEGRCSFSTTKVMGAADYRTQSPGDVLADMALAQGGVNYHVNDYGDGPELTFRNDNTSTADSSTLRISNVLSDASAVTLHPFKDAVLRRSPSKVISHLNYAYEKSTVNEEREATATAFNGERGGTASNSNVKSEAKAREDAQEILWQRHLEEDFIECTVLATDAQVNLMPPGWRIEAKFSHLATEGYGSFTWFRILEVGKTPIVADGALYHVRLRLSPQEPAEPAPAAGYIVQSVFDYAYEGGIDLTLPNAVTPGNLLVFLCGDRGEDTPVSPNYLDGALERFGSGAWTKLPNTTNKNDYGSGVAIWYKVADSTSNVGWVAQSRSNMGLFEIAGCTITGAATLDESLHANGLTMSLGSLGTVTSGAVVVAVILWSDQRGLSSPGLPSVTPASGFVTDRFASTGASGGLAESEPFVWIGHALGTGTALTCSITRSAASQLSGIWAGAALELEPA